jgi:hypothetical protein
MDDKKKRSFRKFSFRGVELDKLLDLSQEKVNSYFIAPCRRWLGVPLRGLDGSCAWFGDQGGGERKVLVLLSAFSEGTDPGFISCGIFAYSSVGWSSVGMRV